MRRCLILAVVTLAMAATMPPEFAGADGDSDADPPTAHAKIIVVAPSELGDPDREMCLLDARNPHLPEGLAEGDQIRIARADGREFALFTVKFRRGPAELREVMGLSERGAKRLDFADGTAATDQPVMFDGRAVRDDLDEAAARRAGEFLEITRPAEGHFLLVLAPHGGSIEIGSDAIAEKLAGHAKLARPATLWLCKGFGNGAYDRWHITSTDISEQSFAGLARVGGQNRYRHCVSIHGHSGRDILIGGAGTADTKAKIKAALDALNLGIESKILRPGERFSGTAARNIVNRYSRDGVQLELPRHARTDHADAIAEALAGVFAR